MDVGSDRVEKSRRITCCCACCAHQGFPYLLLKQRSSTSRLKVRHHLHPSSLQLKLLLTKQKQSAMVGWKASKDANFYVAWQLRLDSSGNMLPVENVVGSHTTFKPSLVKAKPEVLITAKPACAGRGKTGLRRRHQPLCSSKTGPKESKLWRCHLQSCLLLFSSQGNCLRDCCFILG